MMSARVVKGAGVDADARGRARRRYVDEELSRLLAALFPAWQAHHCHSALRMRLFEEVSVEHSAQVRAQRVGGVRSAILAQPQAQPRRHSSRSQFKAACSVAGSCPNLLASLLCASQKS
jgi:hypothetical protein